MLKILSHPIFNKQDKNASLLSVYACFVPLFLLLFLWIDSPGFALHYFDGRYLTDLITLIYVGLMFAAADGRLRKRMFVMVPLSYLGELIFCTGLSMYDYRTPYVPFYVPFGHAIVYATGYIFAHTQWAERNEHLHRAIFIVLFILIFMGVWQYRNDVFSLIFGIAFFGLLLRKKWQNLYFFIAMVVMMTELIGASLGCWAWYPITLGGIPTANPPMGAVFFYGGGDVLLDKIVRYYERKIGY